MSPRYILKMLAAIAMCVPLLLPSIAAAQGTDSALDVIPRAWITADGRLPRVPPPAATTRDGRAFIFPSLRAQASADRMVTFAPAEAFFGHRNRAPRRATFRWPSREPGSIAIDIRRVGSAQQHVTFDIDDASMTALRRLPWPRFKRLQRGLRRWLLCRAGNIMFGNPERRFIALDDRLAEFWVHALAQASFARFSKEYLRDSPEFDLVYASDDETVRMRATPIVPPETLTITWGGTAVYPQLDTGILMGTSRPTVGGRTELQILRADSGLTLFPAGTQRLKSRRIGTGHDTDVLLPFSETLADLFDTVFVPVYTPRDLLSASLFEFRTGTSQAPTLPRFLFLLSPTEYLATEPGKADQKAISQFTSDGRTRTESHENVPLTRRYILVGTQQNSEVAVNAELKRLMVSAKNGQPTGDHGHVMAVFANHSVVEIRRHVTVNGQHVEASKPRHETWDDVVRGAMLPVFAAEPTPSDEPALIVRRVLSNQGTPCGQLTIRFRVADPGVLATTTIAEGDEFDRPSRVSKTVR
jgi:hypothetical protein